ncbi:hypothetical protein VTL71DRAFT_15856, partial [Oculimacula yallundae]
MDLLSSIRKEGSRGGVNFSWDDVQTSQHRENYLGHSLMAPVGRWQKGKDLSWYAKGDDTKGVDGETAEEKKLRERREEIKRIKEAEEDALARALGLPVADRNVTGSNAISVGEVNRAVKEAGVGEEDEVEDMGKGKGFGGFVGKADGGDRIEGDVRLPDDGGLVKKSGDRHGREGREGRDRGGRKGEDRSRSRERRHRKHRHRSRSGERRRHRSRSGDRHRTRRPREDRDHEERKPRERSAERKERRPRSRSPNRGRHRPEREERRGRERPRRSRSPERPRRSRSPEAREFRSSRREDGDRR